MLVCAGGGKRVTVVRGVLCSCGRTGCADFRRSSQVVPLGPRGAVRGTY